MCEWRCLTLNRGIRAGVAHIIYAMQICVVALLRFDDLSQMMGAFIMFLQSKLVFELNKVRSGLKYMRRGCYLGRSRLMSYEK